MPDITPRKPQFRTLLWSDTVLDLQETIQSLDIDAPLYIVGGAVRDAFLHFPVKDLDLATLGDSIKIARQIANALDGDIFVMDDERGVARVLLDTEDGKLTIDVAKYRGDDLMADILGRDFTVNAMACDLLGDLQLLIDPLNGEQDAMQKVIRRCTDISIADDPIRALRAIRQSTQLKFKIEPQTVADIRQYGHQITETSAERIRDEFFKILDLQRTAVAIQVLHALGLLQTILPEIAQLDDKALPAPNVFTGWKQATETIKALMGLLTTISYKRDDSTAASFQYGMLAMQLDRFRAQLNAHFDQSSQNERSYTGLMMLGALLHRLEDAPIVAGAVADDLRLSSAEKKRLVAMIQAYEASQTVDYQSNLALHRYWYPLGDYGIDGILLGLADYLAIYGSELSQDDWLIQVERALMMLFAYYEQQDTIVNPELLLNGNDIMQIFNLDGSPLIGELLTQLREAQVIGEITTRDEAIQQVENWL